MKTAIFLILALVVTTAAIVYSEYRLAIKERMTFVVYHRYSYPDEDRQYILEAVNRERKAHGLEPLTISLQLTEAAKLKAQAMVDQSFFSHTDPDGTRYWTYITTAGYEFRQAGENLAENFSAKEAVKAWINSPSHYENIINPDFEETGIWIEGRYIVQMFGKPR